MARRRGRILPDASVDQAHLERREAIVTLKLIAWFVALACVCLGLAWLLQEKLGR